MPSMPLSCKECCMQFTGPVPYMDHMQSAKHKKKMASLNQTDASAPATDSKGVAAIKGSSILRHPLPFACKLCNVSMNCEAALTAHNKGKRHQRALKSQGTIQQSTEESYAGSAMATSSVVAPTQVPSTAEDLSCEFCGIVLFKSMEYKVLHLETDAHRKNKQWAVAQQGYKDEREEPNLKRQKTSDYQESEVTGGPNGGYNEYGGSYEYNEHGGPNDGYSAYGGQ
ncbi:zinc finger RNA-binding protein-like [Dermacentor variabilis]|uniref:zinc finger RNA-binding protein-like n=1 Tax=Dermacentor variabilis TaxID=34621 RepID=UPI003F5C0F62